MRLFRGIAVPSEAAERTVDDTRGCGLVSGQGRWAMEIEYPSPLETLFQKNDLSTQDTRSGTSYPVVCACGEVEGAAYYAFKHNCRGEKDTPVMIEFESDVRDVSIDGRDFLYTVFQTGDAVRASAILSHIFGPNILRYAHKAWESEDQDYRIALCDLASCDADVIASHYCNRTVLLGRHGTVFRNAFFVRLPVGPKSITRVWTPDRRIGIPSPEICLVDCRTK